MRENISINSRQILQNQYGNMKGSTRKYVDRKCLLYSTKFIYIYIYIYIYIITVLVVTKSISGFVANQVQYNMESAQYLG